MRHQGSPFPLAGELFAQSKKLGKGVARLLAASATAMFAEATRNRTCLHAPEVAHSYTTSKELLGVDADFYCTYVNIHAKFCVDFGAFMLGHPSGICETHQLKWARLCDPNRRSELPRSHDLIHRRLLLELARQVDHGHIRGRHAER